MARFLSRIRTSFIAAAWLLAPAVCWAQGARGHADQGPKSYVVSYMIIIFAVGLGLLVICRSGKRSVTFRRDD
jgi:hypothetical protein